MRLSSLSTAVESHFPMVTTDPAGDPTGSYNCAGCGATAAGGPSEGGRSFCNAGCLKARIRRARLRPGLASMYPDLPFDTFSHQNLFHHINLSTSRLQLVHKEPYVFVVRNFLSALECDQLLAKAQTSPTPEFIRSRAPCW